MKRRIFSGSTCEQLVYPVNDGTNILTYTPEKKKGDRFKNTDEYLQFKIDISKRNHARIFNANFGPTSVYSTLTFDVDWEVHTFPEAKRIRDNYVRSLKRKYPDAVMFLYMGRGKGTDRIHFHMVSEGIPQEFLSDKWKYGSVKRFSNLREHNWYDGVDYGRDYTGLANYLFDHWTPEVGGHRWFQTKNTKKPETEKPTEVNVLGGYSAKRPPKPPKGYMLVEAKGNRYGFWRFKYVIVPQKDPRRGGQKNRTMHRLD